MRSEEQAARPLVDFHLHTTASDGRKTPEQVVAQAAATGLCRMAVTDHDTVAGVAPARRAAAGRISLVPGIEFTCREQELVPGAAPFTSTNFTRPESWGRRSVAISATITAFVPTKRWATPHRMQSIRQASASPDRRP